MLKLLLYVALATIASAVDVTARSDADRLSSLKSQYEGWKYGCFGAGIILGIGVLFQLPCAIVWHFRLRNRPYRDQYYPPVPPGHPQPPVGEFYLPSAMDNQPVVHQSGAVQYQTPVQLGWQSRTVVAAPFFARAAASSVCTNCIPAMEDKLLRQQLIFGLGLCLPLVLVWAFVITTRIRVRKVRGRFDLHLLSSNRGRGGSGGGGGSGSGDGGGGGGDGGGGGGGGGGDGGC